MDAIKPELQVEMQESEYGTQQPTVMASFDERLVYRMAKAYLYRLAAEIEELSVMEAWVVRVGEGGSLGKGRPHVARVWLELAKGPRQKLTSASRSWVARFAIYGSGKPCVDEKGRAVIMAHSHLEQEKMQQTIRERLRPESVEAPANQLDVPEAQGGTRP